MKLFPFTGKALMFDLTIGPLTTGQTFKCNDIAEILGCRKNITKLYKGFNNYVEVMKNVGGEEVIEYT